MKDTANIITVKPESIVSIEISGGFLSKLNALLLRYMSSIPVDDLPVLMYQIKQYNEGDTESLDDDRAKDLNTLLTLINVIDAKFKTNGLVSSNKVEYETTEQNKADIQSSLEKLQNNDDMSNN